MTLVTRRRLAATLAGALTATLAAAGSMVAVTTVAGAAPDRAAEPVVQQ
jgi:hypothetical protein